MVDREKVSYFGASVRGPAHRAESKPNEDCWLGATGRFGSLIVVSDGLGSKPQARRGAQSACIATLRAVRSWFAEDAGPVERIPARIEALWLDAVAPYTGADCASTCLVAAALRDGRTLVAALGDGMAAVRVRGVVERVEPPRGAAFLNETMCLGGTGAWSIRCFDSSEVDAVVLASDGVADDLVPERIPDFVEWLVEDIAPLAPPLRWRTLRRELTDWPTPRHLDDKTLAVLLLRPLGAS